MTDRRPMTAISRYTSCAECGVSFDRGYAMNARRAAKPQYCGKACFMAARRRLSGGNVSRRFWEKVERRGTNDCWPWTGHKRTNGYGWFNIGGGKSTNASRAAYILTHNITLGPSDYVCHSCDNPECCNPNHLWLGDVASNTRDMDRKGRRVNGAPRLGTHHHNAKLTPEIAAAISASGETDSVLAARYGVTPSAIYNVRKGKAWAHITGIVR